MTTTTAESAQRTGVRAIRLKAAIIAAGALGVLVAAALLTPDPRGFGTHEQLGLPPCISSSFLRFPCPLCGMTTSFSLMAHARPLEALHAQPAGAVLFTVCVAIVACALTTAILGRAPRRAATLAQSPWGGAAIITLLAGSWIYKLIDFLR